ncbi:hypothetical protein [Pedobacter sp. NJ-S-72]
MTKWSLAWPLAEWLWCVLRGHFVQVEVGRFQAKETIVNKDKFRPFPVPEETEKEFYDTFFNNNTTPEVRTNLQKNGFPYGLWGKYRTKYNWRLRIQFYKPSDQDTVRYNGYVNGEQEILFSKNLSAETYLSRPVLMRIKAIFANRFAEVNFDEKETMAAFETLAKENKNIPIDLIAKTKFQYTDLTLTLVAGKKEIPLLKATTKIHTFR